MANALPLTLQPPKARFQAQPNAQSLLRDITGSSIFQVAADAALLEYIRVVQSQAQGDVSGNMAAAFYFKIQGAQEFLALFVRLSETAEPRTVTAPQTLNHKV